MKTLKVLLQEVVSGIKAWVNSNFAQESNTVHKTGNETVNGEKTFTGNLIHQNSRSIYRNTNISRETPPEANTAVDTYSHLGADWAYWGGLKHIWKTDGTSITELTIANHRQVNGTWHQGFWSLQLSALKDFSNIEFIPSGDAVINLGSSSKQWKSVYAKNYFYNGTAWGLDKANEWTQEQTYSTGYYGQMIWLKNTDLDLSVNGNTGLSSTYQQIIKWVDKNKTAYSIVQSWTNSSENVLVLRSYYRTDANTSNDLSVRFASTATNKIVYPETNADTDLGNSNHKWKTLNGINPGALSLPKGYTEEGADKDYIDIKSVIQTLDNTEYHYTLPDNGWICVRAEQAKRVHVTLTYGWVFGQSIYSSVNATLIASAPFRKGDQITLKVEAITLQEARFYPMQGNV